MRKEKTSSEKVKKPKKKKSFIKRFFISLLSTLLILGLVLVGGYKIFVGWLFSGMEVGDSLSKEEAGIVEQEYHDENIVNIALFGVDTLKDDMSGGRSDSIIIVSLDKKTKEIRLSAIQRDSYVTIDHPKKGEMKDKINHAYAYGSANAKKADKKPFEGGGELAVKTLNQNFGLDIQHYVVINFDNMEQVVDTLGGIELEVTSAYRREANHHITALANARKIKPDLIDKTGKQLLNGMQVLGMMRARKQVGGVGVRSEMHEILLNACFEKLKEKNLTEYPALGKELLKLVKTTLSPDYVIETAKNVVVDGYEIRQGVFPLAQDLKGYGGKKINGVYYLTFNEETTAKNLQDFIYDGILHEEEKKK